MKYILILLVAVTVISCGNKKTPESIVKHYMDSVLHDPKSYELVSLKLIDTLTTSKKYLYLNDNLTELLKIDSLALQTQIDRRKNFPTLFSDKIEGTFDYKMYHERLLNIANNKKIGDSIIANNLNKVLGYQYIHNYRAKNKMGALTLSEDYIYFNTDMKIVKEFNDVSEYSKHPYFFNDK
jgi:hypothetical protein